MGNLSPCWRLSCLVLLVLPIMGCSRKDSDCLSRIARKVAARLGTMTGEMKDSLASGWQSIGGELGLETRVSARLRWDKKLEEAAFEVRASGHDVELKGTVKDQAQRQRALDLAENTSGVEKVTDQLEIAPAAASSN